MYPSEKLPTPQFYVSFVHKHHHRLPKVSNQYPRVLFAPLFWAKASPKAEDLLALFLAL